MTERFTVGQKVALTTNPSDIPCPRIVESVSPSGRVKLVDDGSRFLPSRAIYGGGRWDYAEISPWTANHDASRRAGIVTALTRATMIGFLAGCSDAELTAGLAVALTARSNGVRGDAS